MNVHENTSTLTPTPAAVFKAAYKGPLEIKPLHRSKRLAYNLLSTVLFPLGLSRLLKHGFHLLLGKVILSTQQTSHSLQKSLSLRKERLKKWCHFQDIRFKTPDNSLLEGLYIAGKDSLGQPLPSHAATIIYFNGYDEYQEYNSLIDTYEGRFPDDDAALEDEFIPQYKENALDVFLQAGYNVLFFNYRGVGLSEGKATRLRLLLDGEAAFQYVTDHLKVAEENVLLFGHSLGGAIATEVAALHPNVQICNDRSFSSLQKEVRFLFNEAKHPILGFIAAIAISALGWNFKSEQAWNQIQGRKLIAVHDEDGVVPKEARLFHEILSNKPPLKGAGRESNRLSSSSAVHLIEISPEKTLTKFAILKMQQPNGANSLYEKEIDEEDLNALHNRNLTVNEAKAMVNYFSPSP